MFQLVSDFFRDSRHTPVWASGDVQVVLYQNVHDLENKWINWDKNRPPDPVRVQAIVEYFQLHDVRLIPGLVSIWVDANRTHHVYDGIHRLMAAAQTAHPIAVLVLYRDTTREQDIIDDFLNLNKSISVPSIYLEPSSAEVDQKRRVCVGLVDELCKRYAAFQSASRKPSRHNFNRDNWIEFVSSWNIDFTASDLPTRVIRELTQLNVHAKRYAEQRHYAVPQKCVQQDWYAFFLPVNVIQEHMERVFGRLN